MSDEQKAMENEVFNQELSLDDLNAVAGGGDYGNEAAGDALANLFSPNEMDADTSNCFKFEKRPFYAGGSYPNCAATVEDGSWCKQSDACYSSAVNYQGMTSCGKAWQ